jgi:hypothetical protein
VERSAPVEEGVRAAGAWGAVSRRPPRQGHHFNHGAKVAAFTIARASIAERVEDVGYLFRERLGDIEAVAADVEEGATIAEAVLEACQVVTDAVEGAEPPDEAGGDPLAGSRWGSRLELDFGHRRALPHGGRQLLWGFRDSSHGDGLSEGLDRVRRWVRLRIVPTETPRFTQVQGPPHRR